MSTSLLVLNDDDVARLLPNIDVRGALARMFRGLSRGEAAQPPQTLTLFPNGGGDFITYLGAIAEEQVFGAKLSPYIPAGGAPIVTAWTMLMSMATGAPILLCDAKRLTTERTAGTTALAVDLLAVADARVLTIVGTGPVGLAHLRHAEGLRSWAEVRLCSPTAPRNAALPKRLAIGVPITLHDDADIAAVGADVVMLCTSSGTPVIDISRLRAGTLVTSISTNAADAHEIDPASLGDVDAYCDYAASTPGSAGEMKLAVAAGTWNAGRLRGDLPSLVGGTAAPPSGDRAVFFRSIGLGLEDIAVAAALHALASKESVA